MPTERGNTTNDQYTSYLYPTRFARDQDLVALRNVIKSNTPGTIVIRPCTSEGGSHLVIKSQQLSDQQLQELLGNLKSNAQKSHLPEGLLRAITRK